MNIKYYLCFKLGSNDVAWKPWRYSQT